MLKKHDQQRAFWLFSKFKITSRKPAVNGAHNFIDNYRKSF
jgi:hypothetical protein